MNYLKRNRNYQELSHKKAPGPEDLTSEVYCPMKEPSFTDTVPEHRERRKPHKYRNKASQTLISKPKRVPITFF